MNYKGKIFFAAIFCLLYTGVYAQDYFRNGKGKTTKSQRTGTWKFFYDDGTLSAAGAYKNGLKDGSWEMYYENGKLHLRGVYQNGILTGDFDEFDAGGQPLIPPPDVMNVDIAPSPPQGEIKAFKNWVAQNYVIPPQAFKAKVDGTIIATFIVEADGRIGQIFIVGDLGYGTGEELERVLRMSEKWKPGVRNGKPLRVKYKLPLYIRAS